MFRVFRGLRLCFFDDFRFDGRCVGDVAYIQLAFAVGMFAHLPAFNFHCVQRLFQFFHVHVRFPFLVWFVINHEIHETHESVGESFFFS